MKNDTVTLQSKIVEIHHTGFELSILTVTFLAINCSDIIFSDILFTIELK